MGIAVYIATTAGPIRIERIVEEDVPQSNVFVGRGYKPLAPVSNDYDDFVAPGGPVERAFGPFETTSFRLDVSSPIDTGNSWELGVFVAHGLAKAGRLASLDDKVDATILLTGRVDTDLKVGSVGHINEKFKSAFTVVDDCADKGLPVTFFLPEDDAGNSSILDESVRVTRVATTDQILSQIQLSLDHGSGLPVIPAGASTKPQQAAKYPRLFSYFILFIVAAGGIGYMMINGPNSPAKDKQISKAANNTEVQTKPLNLKEESSKKTIIHVARKPNSTPIIVTVYERRPPLGSNCADIHFFRYDAVETAVDVTEPGVLTPSIARGLCGLRFKFQLAEGVKQGVAQVTVFGGEFLSAEKQGFPEDGILKFESNKSWLADLPINLHKLFRYTITAYEGGMIGDPAASLVSWHHELKP